MRAEAEPSVDEGKSLLPPTLRERAARYDEGRSLLPAEAAAAAPQPLAAALRLGGWASGAYLATYGFKKAWSACSYPAGETLLGMQTKVALGVAHFCGYLAGKVSGVALVARLPQHRLRRWLHGIAATSLLGWAALWALPLGVGTLGAMALASAPLALAAAPPPISSSSSPMYSSGLALATASAPSAST